MPPISVDREHWRTGLDRLSLGDENGFHDAVEGAQLGDPNDTACHLDIPMRSCSLFLDGDPVVLDGAVVAKDLRALG